MEIFQLPRMKSLLFLAMMILWIGIKEVKGIKYVKRTPDKTFEPEATKT
jgi:hypothetical protein